MAEVIDVDMAESQPEKEKRLRDATNVHNDDAADDESPLKKLCDDDAKAALTLRTAQPQQLDLKALALASVAAAGASPVASTMVCALGPYEVPYVPKEGYSWKTVTATDGTVQSVEYVPNEEPVVVLPYEPLSLETADDGTLAAAQLQTYLDGLRSQDRVPTIGIILAACHSEGDVGGARKTQAQKDRRKAARLTRFAQLTETLTLATLRRKMPKRFKDDSPPKYGDPNGVEVGWMPDPTAWPIDIINGVDVAGPPVVKHWRYSSATDVGTDLRFPMEDHNVVSRKLRGGATNFDETIVVRRAGTPDRYDAASLRLGVDANLVEVVHIAHGQPIRTSNQNIAERKQKEDEKRAEKWEETLAADAAHRARVAAAVAKVHGIASPTVARAATVTQPFSDQQLEKISGDMWAAVKKAKDAMDE
jgi:hypothetical protein